MVEKTEEEKIAELREIFRGSLGEDVETQWRAPSTQVTPVSVTASAPVPVRRTTPPPLPPTLTFKSTEAQFKTLSDTVTALEPYASGALSNAQRAQLQNDFPANPTPAAPVILGSDVKIPKQGIFNRKPMPVAVIPQDKLPKDWPEMQTILKERFPKVKFETVQDNKGQNVMMAIGVSASDLNAALKMEAQLRFARKELRKLKPAVDKANSEIGAFVNDKLPGDAISGATYDAAQQKVTLTVDATYSRQQIIDALGLKGVKKEDLSRLGTDDITHTVEIPSKALFAAMDTSRPQQKAPTSVTPDKATVTALPDRWQKIANEVGAEVDAARAKAATRRKIVVQGDDAEKSEPAKKAIINMQEAIAAANQQLGTPTQTPEKLTPPAPKTPIIDINAAIAAVDSQRNATQFSDMSLQATLTQAAVRLSTGNSFFTRDEFSDPRIKAALQNAAKPVEEKQQSKNEQIQEFLASKDMQTTVAFDETTKIITIKPKEQDKPIYALELMHHLNSLDSKDVISEANKDGKSNGVSSMRVSGKLAQDLLDATMKHQASKVAAVVAKKPEKAVDTTVATQKQAQPLTPAQLEKARKQAQDARTRRGNGGDKNLPRSRPGRELRPSSAEEVDISTLRPAPSRSPIRDAATTPTKGRG